MQAIDYGRKTMFMLESFFFLFLLLIFDSHSCNMERFSDNKFTLRLVLREGWIRELIEMLQNIVLKILTVGLQLIFVFGEIQKINVQEYLGLIFQLLKSWFLLFFLIKTFRTPLIVCKNPLKHRGRVKSLFVHLVIFLNKFKPRIKVTLTIF